MLVIGAVFVNNKYERELNQHMKDNTRFQQTDSVKNAKKFFFSEM